MSGFNWGLTPSGKGPEKPKEPEEPNEAALAPAGDRRGEASTVRAEETEDDPFAIFTVPAEPDLPPTEAMPTSQEPYRPAPVAPVEPPVEPSVFPTQPPAQYSPPPFRPPSQYPVSQHPSPDAPAVPTTAFPVAGAPATSASPGIDDIFGESAFREYEDAPLLAQLPLRRDVAAARPPRAPLAPSQRVLIGVAAGLVAALVLVLVFVLGTNLPGLVPAAASQPTASALPQQPTKTVAPTTGTLAPGVHAWNALNGGECIDPFDSAWAAEFTVVDCAQGHGAQLVAKGAFADATFPGADKLAKEAKTACVSSKVIDYDAASTYDDLQLSASYATTQAEWDAGFTSYYCFVSRPDRQIDGNLAKGA